MGVSPCPEDARPPDKTVKSKGAGADLTKIQPAGIRTKSGGARSIEGGKGPAGSGLSLGVAGVENGGRKDATFLRPPW